MIELLLQADRLLTVDLVDAADAIYRRVAEADPNNAIAVVGMARCALARGEDHEAYRLAARALTIDPRNDMARRMEARLDEVLRTRGEVPGEGGVASGAMTGGVGAPGGMEAPGAAEAPGGAEAHAETPGGMETPGGVEASGGAEAPGGAEADPEAPGGTSAGAETPGGAAGDQEERRDGSGNPGAPDGEPAAGSSSVAGPSPAVAGRVASPPPAPAGAAADPPASPRRRSLLERLRGR